MSELHKNLSAGRWNTLTSMQQLGNIGSEVERTLRAQEQGDSERFKNAFERTLELTDLTITDPKWSKRLKEILRIREVFCDYCIGSNIYSLTPAHFRKDFLHYGIAARPSK